MVQFDHEDYAEIADAPRLNSRDVDERLRSNKLVRGGKGKEKKAQSVAGIRLRRNKRWNW